MVQCVYLHLGTVHYLRTRGTGDFEGGPLIFGKSPMGEPLNFGAKNFEEASKTHFFYAFRAKIRLKNF